jgi:polyhydroxyalkanoate synthesis repressor PhaR
MTEGTQRVIKRYANRKLYDTQESRYVTLDQIAEMIRNSEDVKVIDNNSKEDLTSVTLAQIIFEEEKRQRSFLPLAALRNIIQSGGESLQELTNLISESAGRMGRVFRSESSAAPEEGAEVPAPADGETADAGDRAASESANMFKDFMDGVQSAIDDWQKRIETSVNTAVESVSPFAPLQKEIQILGERISELERAVGQLEDTPADDSRRPEP